MPNPRFSRNASDYDLHETAGGMPLLTFTASNVHHMSKHRREACKPGRKSNFPNKKCGSKRTRYAPSRKNERLFFLFVDKIHDQIRNCFKFRVIFNGDKQRLAVFLFIS